MENVTNFDEEVRKIIKFIRKQYKLQQEELGQIIQMSQSKISKVESGKLVLSLSAYTKMCLEFNIPLDSYLVGHIDSSKEVDYTSNQSRDHGFKLSRDCLDFPTIAVREIYPFLEFTKHTFGEAYLHRKLKEFKVDDLYFYKLDNLIGPKFLANFSSNILEEKNISLSDVFESEIFSRPSSHGALYHKINAQHDLPIVLDSFCHLSLLYDANFERNLEINEDQSELKLVMKATPSYMDFRNKLTKDQKYFINNYYFEFTKGICSLASSKNEFRLSEQKTSESQWTYVIKV